MRILFLCTANLHRSRTAEDYFDSKCSYHEFKSAGLSEKYCKKHGTTLCTTKLLDWADKVFVMEGMHAERIITYAGQSYLEKLEILNIEDIYKYMQKELIEKLKKLEHTILS
ncbi:MULTISPECIES: hypothetical protein [unclassified Shewanella]|uniref:hypothetical protein n=1 Tax=unclassified Shewanella TaxID=196818 RepID=UPI00354BF51C